MSEQEFEFNVGNDYANFRLDVFLTEQLEAVSRSHIQKLISSGKATVNNSACKSNHKLQTGDEICVLISEPEPAEVLPEKIALDILYEDADVIVVNKNRGMVVHPAAGNYSGTLVNALLGHCNDLSGINGVIRPGIVHRLDKETSGVMIVAKNDRAHIDLAKQIKDRTAGRTYIAIVHGNVKEDHGIINAPIGRHPVDRKKMAVVFTNSKAAITNFTVVERFGEYTVMNCKLCTGRTHQIRVHMAYIGHPVVGDPQYGPQKKHFNISGQALHSSQIVFKHPVTGEEMTFCAPLPSDMQTILEQLQMRKK